MDVPKAIMEERVFIHKTGKTIHINCERDDDAEELMEWIANGGGELNDYTPGPKLDEVLENWIDCGNMGWCQNEGSCPRHKPDEFNIAVRKASEADIRQEIVNNIGERVKYIEEHRAKHNRKAGQKDIEAIKGIGRDIANYTL